MESWWFKYFFSQITIVCLGNFVKCGIPVRFYIESPTPAPSHGVQYSILMALYKMYVLWSPPTYLLWSLFDQLYRVLVKLSDLRWAKQRPF